MRHTAYNDYAAECRIRFFNENGISTQLFDETQIGPVLFKEETSFYREIRLGETLDVTLQLKACSLLGERFKMYHKLYKADGVLAAEIHIFAAWLDLNTRKLTVPPPVVINAFNTLERTADFEEIVLKKKV